MFNVKEISPKYPRIPHASSESMMTHDDIKWREEIQFPLTCWVQEKIDGANMGASWNMEDDVPILRNREHILKKGYQKKNTPAKIQFRSAWNWLHKNHKDLKKVIKRHGELTIYGEWMYFQHSINYDRLPDWFIAYDVYSPYDGFLHPEKFIEIMEETKISYIRPYKKIFNSIEEIIQESELDSDYRSGIREGIVIKSPIIVKMVNSQFVRRSDFNDNIIKNSIG